MAHGGALAGWCRRAFPLGAGLAIGGISAGVILDHAQWRWIFAPVAGTAVVILLIAVLALADSRAPAGRTLDWFGQVLAAIAVAALVYGVIEGGSTSWSFAHAVAGFAVAAVAVLGFIPVELIAWRIAAACVVMMVAGPIAGLAMKALSPVVLMVAGLLITATALLWSISLDPGTGFRPTAGRVALLGFGLGILLNVVQQAGLGGAAAYPYGAHASAVRAAFGDSLTRAMHICTLVARTGDLVPARRGLPVRAGAIA